MKRAWIVLRAAFAPARPPTAPDATAFTGHRNVTPLLWTVVGLSVGEIGLVHLLLRRWSETAAFAATALSVAVMIYLVAIARSLPRAPTLITPQGLRLRAGVLIDESMPWDAVSTVVACATTSTAKDPHVFKVAMLSTPNVRIVLKSPRTLSHILKGPREAREIALYLDDPAGFVAAAQSHLAAR